VTRYVIYRKQYVAIRRVLSLALLKSLKLKRSKNMIQIVSEHQFTNAAIRAQKERMLVQPAGFRRYYVTNKAKGTRYEVFFTVSRDGRRFGTCNCPAGYPMHRQRIPQVCKHLYVALSLHLALMSNRQTSH
jgi:hypothetical protein